MNSETQPEQDIDKIPLTTLERWSGQYRVLSEHKQRLHNISTEQIVLGQIFTLTVVMAVSAFLELQKEALLAIGTTLLLYPALADMLSSNAAVLSSSVHHDIETVQGSKLLGVLAVIARTLFVTILASMVIGFLGGVIGAIFFETPFITTFRLAALSGTLTGIVGLPFMAIATFIVRKIRANPDAVSAPLETAIFSSLTLLVIMTVSRYV